MGTKRSFQPGEPSLQALRSGCPGWCSEGASAGLYCAQNEPSRLAQVVIVFGDVVQGLDVLSALVATRPRPRPRSPTIRR